MDDQRRFDAAIRSDLAISLLGRADQSGETIRALLFAAAGGALGLLLSEDSPTLNLGMTHHGLSIALFLTCGGVVMMSWHVQKYKASKRFNAVLNHGVAELRTLQASWRRKLWLWNSAYDTIAAFAFGAGIVWETYLRSNGA